MSDETSFFYVILFFVLIGVIVVSIVALIGLFGKWKEKGFKRTDKKSRHERSMLPGLFDQPIERTEAQTAKSDTTSEAQGIETLLLCSRQDNLNPVVLKAAERLAFSMKGQSNSLSPLFSVMGTKGWQNSCFTYLKLRR